MKPILQKKLRTAGTKQLTINITIVDERQKVLFYCCCTILLLYYFSVVVLFYWIKAVTEGTIPKRDITLIRFDKHSSLAAPFLLEGYPLNQIPTLEMIKYLLQSNDQYVMAALLTGLIREVIWIWPKWDYKSHFEKYSLSFIQAGLTNVKDNKNKQEICMCIFDSDSGENTCFHNSVSDMESGVVNIDYTNCDVEHTVKYVEISEDLAAEYFKRKYDGGKSSAETILDIDVDFLNFMDANTILFQANVSRLVLEDLDSNLSRLFCPKNGAEETVIDKLITEFIHFVLFHKNRKSSVFNTRFTKFYEYGMKYFRTRDSKWLPYTCSVTAGQKNLFLKRFVRTIVTLSSPQLDVIKETGFCLSTVRQSVKELPEKQFTICASDSKQSNTEGFDFNPETIRGRLQNFTDTLQHISKSPVRLVTVCRSVRDGYTHRASESYLERLILNTLQKKLSNTKICYDHNLLGGKIGFRTNKQK
ncbi:uncharacterized protein LOC133183987 [Saccostrea echinata]|uniref:uncharacterized protein LOC133183987 n=1 Tax=Saccostrea echinata TaxID=191078 RepID=UPI002A7FD9D3|nr:uncharacterized protein LOC133183987 [Saccostrea echinata]